jgi:hypothetical protein
MWRIYSNPNPHGASGKEDFFFNINISKYGFPYCQFVAPPISPRGHDVNNSESTLYQKSFM